MPATFTDDWQAILVERDFKLGRGTNYPGIGGISGAGPAQIQAADLAGVGDGDRNGVDRYAPRTLLIPVTILGDTDDAIWDNQQALATAWRISRRTDLELSVRLPGAAADRSVFGRPRGLQAVPLRGLKGALVTTATFRCGDPFAYSAIVDSGTDSATPLTIASASLGDEDTNRVTLTIVGNGGTPEVTNDQGGTITFASTLAGAAVAVLNVRDRTITVDGTPAPEVIDPASTWFDLVAGAANVLAWTGAASLRAQYRPAWGTL